MIDLMKIVLSLNFKKQKEGHYKSKVLGILETVRMELRKIGSE